MLDETVTLIVVVDAHCPVVGVKVYTVVPAVAVDMDTGFQLPLIPLLEVTGKVPGKAPTQ